MLEFLKMMFKLLNQNSGALLVVFSLVVTGATVFYVILTRSLVSESRKMREAQTEPNIFVSLHSKEDWVGLIDLVIQNIGLGAAYNLKFELKPDFEYSKGQFLSELNFIKNGVNYLAPSQKIKHFLTSLVGKKELEKTKIEFEVKYENSLGKLSQKNYILDFSEFYGRLRVGEPSLKKIADNLEKIQKDIHTIMYSSYPRIKVVTHTKKDMEEEYLKMVEEERLFEEKKKKK